MALQGLTDEAQEVSKRIFEITKRYNDLTKFAESPGFRSETMSLIKLDENMHEAVCNEVAKKLGRKYFLTAVLCYDGNLGTSDGLRDAFELAVRENRMVVLIRHLNTFCPTLSNDDTKAENCIRQLLKCVLRLRDDDCPGILMFGLFSDARTVNKAVLESPLVKTDRGSQ